jgi:hypothetical protein
MKKLIAVVVIAFAACGCSQLSGDISSITVVKNSYLESVDKSITIGQAFDGYKYFSEKEWTEFTTQQGRKIVQFKASMNDDYLKMYNTNPVYTSQNGVLKYKGFLIRMTVNYDGTFGQTESTITTTYANNKTETFKGFSKNDLFDIYQNKFAIL